jgi:single-stranded DNA-binding protein
MINSVVLVGRLTKDVELRYTPNGVPVATFTLAVHSAVQTVRKKQTSYLSLYSANKPKTQQTF